MSREIKFRAFHKPLKKMYWFDIMWGNNGHGNGWIGMTPFGEEMTIKSYRDNITNIAPDDCEIMQFTGLKDKNGVEIYEGDIVVWQVNNITRTAQVYFDELQASFWMGKDKDLGNLVLNDWMRGEYKVIGNIHQNPELL